MTSEIQALNLQFIFSDFFNSIGGSSSDLLLQVTPFESLINSSLSNNKVLPKSTNSPNRQQQQLEFHSKQQTSSTLSFSLM
ncbi:CLUMA_CG009763, isoform A [Clunio marinus]|uniref:CLUMA_CG009763, isoform A n=1 Tax=Clunio marinus TaxID=568069 RepID=A0A1J1I7V0_9DIPT|nr:CLUMA_CG009763, isoform A [Clunio marinus]